MVENIKTQQQAPDSARGFNLSDPALTDEDKKLLYQEMYGYTSYPSSSIHSSRSASPSAARHRHDWHADFYNNRQELLGDSASGSEAGSLRGSYADIPMTREVDPLAFASNPYSNPSAIGAPHRVPMTAPQLSRAAPPPPPQQMADERKSYEEWSQQARTRTLPPDETVVKMRYLDPQPQQTRAAPPPPPQPNSGSVVDVPEELRSRSVVDVPDMAMAQHLSSRRSEPPFNFTSGTGPVSRRSEPPFNFGPQPSLLSSQRSLPAEPAYGGDPPRNFASHTNALLSSQRRGAEPPFNFVSSASAPMQSAGSPYNPSAPIQVVSPQRGLTSFTTGSSPVRPGRTSLPGFNPGPPVHVSALHSSQPALTSVLNHSFGSDGFGFSDVYHSGDASRGLRSSFGSSFLSSSSLQCAPAAAAALGAAPPAPPSALSSAPAPPNVGSMAQAPWRDNAAPPSNVTAHCTVGQSGAVAKLQWEAGPWQEAVFELQIMLLSVNDDWRTAYVGGDTNCTIPSLRLDSTFAVRVRASDAQSSSNFSPVVHFNTPSPTAPAALASPAAAAPAPAPAPVPDLMPPVSPAAASPKKKKAAKEAQAVRAAAPPPPAEAAPASPPPAEPKSPAVKSAVRSPEASPAQASPIPKLNTEGLSASVAAAVRSPSPRVLAVTTAKEAPPPAAAPPPATPPAVRESAQESSDVGDYVSFNDGPRLSTSPPGPGYLTSSYLANVSHPSYAVQWAGRSMPAAGLAGPAVLRSQAGMGTRTLTSGQYTGMSYGTLVGGGHPLITPIGNRVNYNTGTDILSRSPPAVVFQNQSSGSTYSSGYATVHSTPTRVQSSSLRNTWA